MALWAFWAILRYGVMALWAFEEGKGQEAADVIVLWFYIPSVTHVSRRVVSYLTLRFVGYLPSGEC
jgi:hypothetical protein